jgi:pimeloyl-ACP methyl ester carboxylesterase
MHALLVLCTLALAAPAPTPARGAPAKPAKSTRAGVAWPTPITLTTADGVRLAVNWGAPARADNAVVFLHGQGGTGVEWAPLASRAYNQGWMVEAVDLRGHGGSALDHALVAEDWKAMVQDVRAAVAHVRAQGARQVALVGGEVGANLAIEVAAEDRTIAAVAALSAGVNIKGLLATDAVMRYDARPLLLVVSSSDAYGLGSAQKLLAAARGPKRLETVDVDGRGTRLLGRNPSLESAILGTLQAAWTKATSVAQDTQLELAPTRAVDAGSAVGVQAGTTPMGPLSDGPAAPPPMNPNEL